MREDFAVFILTHGRPNHVITYKTLEKQGYTGKLFLILDNEDETAEEYEAKFGKEKIIVFDKQEIASRIDTGDLSEDRRTIVYARNACFEIAAKMGLRYFLQLDDDYTNFRYRYEEGGKLRARHINDLDKLFSYMIDFLNESGALTVAFAQGGDFVGGVGNDFFKKRIKRKAMNTFFCDVEKPFEFMGRINEDVNMYTLLGNRGELILSVADAQMNQLPTQSNKGGMTDVYLDKGTYLKSFYSVMYSPQCVKIANLGSRIHHRISWEHCTPKILSERWKQ